MPIATGHEREEIQAELEVSLSLSHLVLNDVVVWFFLFWYQENWTSASCVPCSLECAIVFLGLKCDFCN